MKKLFTILIAFALSMIIFVQHANAQVSVLLNPSGYGYTFLSTTTTWTALTGGTVFQSGTTLNTDANSTAITLPFVFTYNGIKENTIFINNNGYITFAKAQTTASNTVPLSTTTTSGYDGAIAGLANNLVAAASGTPEIRYGTNAGGDFVVQYQDMAVNTYTSTRATFQIILKVDAKTIQIVYGPNNTGQASVGGSQVGLRGTCDEDWNNRSLSSGGNWNTAGGTAGTSNTSTMTWTASSTLPTSGRTFQWSPTAYVPTYLATPFATCQEFTSWANGAGPANIPTTNWASNGYGNASWQIDNNPGTTTTTGWGSQSSYGYTPVDYVGATGGHSARFHSGNTNAPQVGYLDYYVDFSSATGVITMDFYAINTSGTDIMQVYLSTNGGSTFSQVGSDIGVLASWTKQTISLGAITSATTIIRFKATSDYGSTDIGLDHVCLSLPAACPIPLNLAAGSVTSNSASISWACAGCTGTYELDYGSNGHAAGSGTILTGVTSPFNLSPPLTGNTPYTIYVRQDCSGTGNGLSGWSDAANFTTLCANQTLTYSENFNSTSIPACWTQAGVTGTSTLSFVALGTNPTVATAFGGSGDMVYWNSYNITNGNQTRLVSAPITTTGSASVDVQFQWYHGTDGGATSYVTEGVQVQYSLNGTDWVDAGSLIKRYDAVAGWSQKTITLPKAAADKSTVFVGFLFTSNYGYNCFLDEVTIMPSPSCLPPTAVGFSDITNNSASINWTASSSGPSNGYDIYYSISSTAPDAFSTPTYPVGAGEITYSTGNVLLANTTYYAWVRSNCGSDLSPWASGGSFKTLCDAANIPITENFNAVTTPNLPDCWKKKIISTSSADVVTYSYTYHSSPNAVYMSNSSDAASEVYLISPQIVEALNTIRVKYWTYSYGTYPVQIGVMSDPTNAATFEEIASFPTSGTWTERVVDFSSYGGSGTYVAIKFVGTSTYESVYIDDITIEAIPTCLEPSGINITDLASTSVTINWTASVSNPADGYDIYYSTSSTAPDALATPTYPVSYGVTTYPTGNVLTANTTYYVWVRSNCGGGDLSAWAGYTSFYTGYCNPAPSSVDGLGITNVTYSTVNNTTGKETNNYGDYTAMVGDVTQGTSVPVYITYSTAYTYGTKIWIDWNNNLIFDDPSEMVYYGLSTNANPTTLAASFTVPGSTPTGNYRMRIGGTDNDTGPSSPCYNGAYGTFEDYTINVIAASLPEITSLDVLSGCAGSSLVINGNNLAGATSVTIGGTAATVTANTATTVTVTVGIGTTGTVDVTTIAGTATSTETFTVNQLPAAYIVGGGGAYCDGVTGVSITLDGSESGIDYNLSTSPITSKSGGGSALTFGPTAFAAGTYTITAANATTGCTLVMTGSASVTVDPLPSTVTISPSSASICEGSILQLDAVGGSIGGSATIGTGSTSNTTTTPYKGYWGGSKAQFLFTASELTAMGLTSGTPISEISFSISSFTGPYTFNNFTIGMKNTTSTVLTTTIETGVTTVLTPATFVLSGTAPFIQSHTLTNPFSWDGTSNLLVETCFVNADGGGTSVNSANIVSTTTTTVQSNYYSNDTQTTVCSAPGIATTSYVRPNITFVFSSATAVTWLPTAGLYTDAGAGAGYTGGSATTLWAKPTSTTTYTVTATSIAGCTNSGSTEITVNAKVTPTFTQLGPYFQGDTPDLLPGTSNNLITGTWSPDIIVTSSTGTSDYTFTPNVGECATSTIMSIQVNPFLPVHNVTQNTYFSTIQPAINAANPLGGDVIEVAAGTYAGNITVNKSLIIIGDPGDALPGVGVNAPVIDGGSLPGSAFLLANGVTNVTIEGFEMRNFTSPDLDGIGNGISAWEASTSNITIQDNYFHHLGYNGILVGNDDAAGDHTNWLVKNNVIENFGYIGFELTNTSNSSIEDNIIHLATPYIGAIFSSARRSETGLTVKDNIIDGTPSATFPVIYMYAYDLDMPNPNLNTVLIEGNTISTIGTPAQIYIRNINTGTVTGVTVINNNILSLRTNTPALVNAVSNYWGSLNGPYNLVSNPCGTVGWVSNNVTFIPWFNDASMTTLGYPTPAPTGPGTQSFCSADGKVVSDLTATLSGTDIKLYSAASAGTLYTGTELLVTGSYFASQTVGGCESIDRKEVAVTITTTVAPTFAQLGPYCQGAIADGLPTNSNNTAQITGTWGDGPINTAVLGTTVYHFTPDAGQCATIAEMSIFVNTPVVPTFNQLGPYCQGAIADGLPTSSNNTTPITGIWSDGPINTAILGTTVYHFISNAGQCATTAEMSILVNTNVVPIFYAFPPYEVGATPAVLPGTSNNGITGTWNPTAINTSSAGIFPYTYTPDAGLCAVSTTLNITIYETSLFQVSQDIGTTLFLSWPAVSGAARYSIYYRPLLSPPGGSWVGNSVSYPFIKAINLTPGTVYECKYIAYKPSGSPIAGGTASGNFTPAHVTFEKNYDIGTTCQIDWNDWSSWASSYVFQYKTGTTWIPLVRYANNGKASNLTPGVTYQCRVIVYRNGSLWGTTETYNFTPLPVVFTLGTHTTTACDISWTSTAPWATSRSFYYRPLTSPPSGNWIGNPTYLNDYIHLNGLTPNTTYECKLGIYISSPWGETMPGQFTLAGKSSEIGSNVGNNGINVYPNPFIGQVKMDLFTKEETNVTWNIFNMTGKLVLSGIESFTAGYSTLNIDATGLSKGVYMLNAIINDQMQSFRIMKQ